MFYFKKWVTSAEANELQMRELVDQMIDQEREILGLLAVSRYAVEESLGMHLLTAARTLTTFHDSMLTQMEETEQKKLAAKKSQIDSPRRRTAQIKIRIDQLSEERDRQMRLVESNRDL